MDAEKKYNLNSYAKPNPKYWYHMNVFSEVIMKLILSVLLFSFFIQHTSAQNNNVNVDGVSGATAKWERQINFNYTNESDAGLKIVYPFEGTMFPADFSPASFIWKSADNNNCEIVFEINGEKIKASSDTCKYKPDVETWERLKEISNQEPISFSVTDTKNKQTVSLHFSFSADAVDAPIFYRAVPLPFRHANTYRDHLEWYLGDVKNNKTRLMLHDVPVCANCHSFSKDGLCFGMDVDYANDKGNYAISSVKEKSEITVDDIISWSDYKREEGKKTFGLLAQISPDGNYVISTVKDQSIFVPVDDNFWYSQLFFPIKGILVSYDIQNQVFKALPGASDESFVQSNPSWHPDMKEIIFARSKSEIIEGLEESNDAVIDVKYAADFIKREKEFKFDLYRIPWDDGNGGNANPIPGASENNKSNYFAKYSPDGKWIVFCQAENFMLLQPDSKLYIMPARGGEPRLMNCNRKNMNSWHSFSPNGKWMVFASKEFGPYTQLFLTHIDENGNDTPPVWLEQLAIDKRAANIPEFVNVEYDKWTAIEDRFTNSELFLEDIVDASLSKGNYEAAFQVADEEIMKDPDHYYGYYVKARALIKTAGNAKNMSEHTAQINSNFNKCIELLNQEIQNTNANVDVYAHLAASYYFTRQITKSVEYCDKTLELDPDNLLVWEALAGIYFERRNFPKAIEANMKLFEITQVPMYANKCAQMKLINRSVQEAVKYAKMALEADNCNDWTLEILGNCYVTLGDFGEAEKYYNDLVQCRPTEAIAYYNRGKFFFNQKEYDKALADLNKSVEIDKQGWIARYYRASVYKELNKFDKAVEDINAALDIEKNNYELFLLKAACQFELGQYEDAKKNATTAKNMIYGSKAMNSKSLNSLVEINRVIKQCDEKE